MESLESRKLLAAVGPVESDAADVAAWESTSLADSPSDPVSSVTTEPSPEAAAFPTKIAPPLPDPQGDNGDGVINLLDFAAFRSNFGK